MTDKPDETPLPDDGATPDEVTDTGPLEPGLVVEDDELDLGDGTPDDEPEADDVAVAAGTAPSEEVPDEDVATDDEQVEDEPVEDEPVEDEPTPEVAAAGFGHAFDPDADNDHHEPVPVTVPAAVSPDGDGPTGDGPKKRRRGQTVLVGALGLVAAAYVAGYFLTGTRMPANTSVGGTDVSAKSPSAARAAVEEAVAPRLADKLALTYGSGDDTQAFTIDGKAAGLAVDVDRSVEQAGGRRSWDPRDMAALFVGDNDRDLAFDVDDAKLQSFIGTIGESINQDVVEAQITFPKDKPTPREPKAGLVVSRSDTARAILSTYLTTDEPIEVPTVPVEPAVDADGLDEAMKTIAEPAVSGPVDLVVGDKTVSLPVSAYTPALVVRVQESQLVAYLDPKELAKPLTSSTTGIGKKAVDATVKIEDNKAVIVPGKEGVGLQPEEMATKLVAALTKTGKDRSVEIDAKVVEPLFTTDDAKALKIKERISKFDTPFPYAPYRNINQGRAAELINGTIIKPGETFSFNKVVGERTVANGFTTGTVINGGVFREELGGGVSQVATTMYNAGFFGGMDDTEHHPHAFYISRYPVGREATVYFGSLDLRWKNPTKYGVLIRAYVVKSTPSSAGQMHVELWSTKVWDVKAGESARRNARSPGMQYDDTDRCVPQAPVAGFDIDIYRTFYQGGKKVKSETDTANYQAADKVVCGKKPDDE